MIVLKLEVVASTGRWRMHAGHMQETVCKLDNLVQSYQGVFLPARRLPSAGPSALVSAAHSKGWHMVPFWHTQLAVGERKAAATAAALCVPAAAVAVCCDSGRA